MNGEADQIDPVQKGVALELAQVGRVLPVHLTVQDIDTGNAEGRGLLDHLFDGDLGRSEMPIGITGDPELDRARFLHRGLGRRLRKERSQRNRETSGEKRLTGNFLHGGFLGRETNQCNPRFVFMCPRKSRGTDLSLLSSSVEV